MSFQYDQYLTQHRSNVKRGFDWIAENLPELLVDGFDYGWQIEFAHDKSKDEQDEYEAYDAYFYGGNRSYAVMQNYQKAWLLHLHRNPHHWQYWILINDDPKEGEIILELRFIGGKSLILTKLVPLQILVPPCIRLRRRNLQGMTLAGST